MKYAAHAKRWAKGWEIHVEGVGVTQVRLLKDAEQQVRDLVETMTGRDASTAEVQVIPDLSGLEERVQRARSLTRGAEKLQREAASESRAVARALRDLGLSVSDSAEVLEVSRGRVSQLVKDTR